MPSGHEVGIPFNCGQRGPDGQQSPAPPGQVWELSLTFQKLGMSFLRGLGNDLGVGGVIPPIRLSSGMVSAAFPAILPAHSASPPGEPTSGRPILPSFSSCHLNHSVISLGARWMGYLAVPTSRLLGWPVGWCFHTPPIPGRAVYALRITAVKISCFTWGRPTPSVPSDMMGPQSS